MGGNIANDRGLLGDITSGTIDYLAEALVVSQGLLPYVGGNGNWWVADNDTGVTAQGKRGDKGDKGDKGDRGPQTNFKIKRYYTPALESFIIQESTFFILHPASRSIKLHNADGSLLSSSSYGMGVCMVSEAVDNVMRLFYLGIKDGLLVDTPEILIKDIKVGAYFENGDASSALEILVNEPTYSEINTFEEELESMRTQIGDLGGLLDEINGEVI